MRKSIILLILLICFTATTSTSTRLLSITSKENSFLLDKFKNKIDLANTKKMYSRGLSNFLEHLANRESSNNPKSINSFGYIGKYQFGNAALKDVGYENITVNKFIKDPDIFSEKMQDIAVIKLMKINKKRIGKLLNKYNGKKINGILITESGLLAAAHLAGAGGVRKFLKSNGRYNPADGYGTRLTQYLKEFQNHKVNLNYT
jgi:hypothetical protein